MKSAVSAPGMAGSTRRIARRTVLNRKDTLEKYAEFLRGNARELDALYSDALGEPGSPGGTYPGMIRHNADTIVKALLP